MLSRTEFVLLIGALLIIAGGVYFLGLDALDDMAQRGRG